MTKEEKKVAVRKALRREEVFRSAYDHARDYCRAEIARIDAKLRAVYESLGLPESGMSEDHWDLPSAMQTNRVVQEWLVEKRFWEDMLTDDVREFFGPAWETYRARKAQEEAQDEG